MEALWLEDPTDLFYLTGLWFSVAKLVLEDHRATLFVDGRYYEIAKKKVKNCEVILFEKEENCKPFKNAKKIGFDSSQLTLDRFFSLKRIYSKQEWIPFSKPLKEIRLIKEKEEIQALKKAAQVTWNGYQHVLKNLKEGISEAELAWLFERFCREHGATNLSFEHIIAFGENSAYPHYRPQKECLLKQNQMVLIDVGALVDHYCGDMTRTHFFGTPDPQLSHLQTLVKQAHDAAFSHAQPGIKLGELDQIVHDFFAKEGVDSLFCHSLGHGIGLEVHEYPRIRFDGVDKDLVLQPGMVFTIEPGLYLPEVGGIRYENTVVITENGIENFYSDLK